MRPAHRHRKTLAALPLATLLAGIVPADAMIDYGPALVDRASLTAKAAIESHPVIADDLMAVVREVGARKSANARLAFADKVNTEAPKSVFVLGEDASRIQVVFRLANTSQANLGALEKLGVEVEFVSHHAPLVQAFAPIDRLEELAALPAVLEINRPNYALATAGTIRTQGDQAMATTLVRNHPVDFRNNVSYNGNAVQVCVASDNLFVNQGGLDAAPCNSLQTVRNLEAPAGLQTELPLGFFPSCDFIPGAGFFGGIPVSPSTLADHLMSVNLQTDEDRQFRFHPDGSAMLEVIHDIAPGASLRYIRGRTDLELIERRRIMDFLSIPVDVMADNLVFSGAGRYDGSSGVSRSATEFARTRNIPFFVSAGGVTPPASFGPTRVQRFPAQITGFFNADPRDTRVKVHSWSGGSATNRDEALSIDAVSGQTIEIVLVWDDLWDDIRPRANIDLDLYLVPRSTLSLSQAVATSARIQNGNGVNPVERLVYFPLSNQPLALVMINKNAGQNIRTLFTLSFEQGQIAESQYLTHGVPFANSDALEPVISVGHIDLLVGQEDPAFDVMPGIKPHATPSNEFIRWYEGQTFPTVMGYSSVNTYTTFVLSSSSTRDQAFTGPSASVAHLAGFAAILRHRVPQMPARRIRELFTTTSVLFHQGAALAPFATDITPTATRLYRNHPTFIRPNPFNIYDAITRGRIDPINLGGSKESVTLVQVDGDGQRQTTWNASQDRTYNAFDLPTYRVSDLGLEMTPTSDFCYGFWQSPLLTVQGAEDNEPRTALRADRLYVAEARVGSTGADSRRVPDFRLRLTSGTGDESALLVVADVAEGVQNAPTTLGGNVYRVYFQPSNAAVAASGVTFNFDMLNFNPTDDQNVTLILRDFSFTELPLPAP